MSATDEELEATHDAGMDHVTYILIFFRSVSSLPACSPSTWLPKHVLLIPRDSLAFIVYGLIVGLLHVYATSGRNAPNAAHTRTGAIELEERAKWYAPVPRAERGGHHIIGDEDDE